MNGPVQPRFRVGFHFTTGEVIPIGLTAEQLAPIKQTLTEMPGDKLPRFIAIEAGNKMTLERTDNLLRVTIEDMTKVEVVTADGLRRAAEATAGHRPA
jgi:hypothetical protein